MNLDTTVIVDEPILPNEYAMKLRELADAMLLPNADLKDIRIGLLDIANKLEAI